jgi:hypothetical protein
MLNLAMTPNRSIERTAKPPASPFCRFFQTLTAQRTTIYIMPLCRFGPIIALAATLTACASTYIISCRDGDQLAIHDSLYFGTAKPNGIVTPEDWAKFLASKVTPRFPRGLTPSHASGQWRGPDGEIVREESHVLQLVHPNDAPSKTAIREVVTTYKTQFQQEAVLRIRAHTCASF